MLSIPVCNGELVDKLTILKIKMTRTSGEKLQNVKTEYDHLYPFLSHIGMTEEHELFQELYTVNLTLWEFQDWQRVFFRAKEDVSFERLDITVFRRLRDEHLFNDRRAKAKKKINQLTNSELVEEKQFTDYHI